MESTVIVFFVGSLCSVLYQTIMVCVVRSRIQDNVIILALFWRAKSGVIRSFQKKRLGLLEASAANACAIADLARRFVSRVSATYMTYPFIPMPFSVGGDQACLAFASQWNIAKLGNQSVLA